MVINFANPGMVGHAGVVEAAIKAVETVDGCVGELMDALAEVGGAAIIIAAVAGQLRADDHRGRRAHTAHTTNLVHCFYVGPDGAARTMHDGILADVSRRSSTSWASPSPMR